MVYIIMKKNFYFEILGIFLTSCSNIGKREEITLKEKESLIVLIEDIKNNLQKGETELLEKTLILSIKK